MKIKENRYLELFNYSHAYISTHDLSGKLLTAHPAICELLGYDEEEIKGKALSDFFPKPDAKKFLPIYLHAIVNEGNAKGVFKFIGRNNKTSYLLFKNFKVAEGQAEPYIICFSQDITDQVKSGKELPAAKKITEDPTRAKETFLANMSHEIRTPMTGILGIATLLSKTELNEQQKKFTKLISESANNLLTIVNDVLDIEKITAGRLDLEYIPFKIEDKVFTTLQSFQFKAEDKNINLLLNSSLPDDLVVVGDPYRLSQILNNLLSNALKFTNDGAITLNIDYAKNEDKSIVVEIQVQDTGIGIRADRLSDIFRPFMQASSDTTRKFGGTGLGLTICKNLVEMQGGRITVDSKVNVGTTFSFYIPYEKGNDLMLIEDSKDDLDYKDLESIKILVAEDVDLNKFLVRHILEAWGCDVTMVNNGREAVEKVKRYHYDLILMDIQMPEMDGITATKIIRSLNTADSPVEYNTLVTKKTRSLNLKDKSTIPIIAITANALKGDGQRYMNYGMDGYITKPYTEEKLFHAINQVIKTNDKLKLKVTPSGNKPLENNPNGKEKVQEEQLYDLSMVISLGKDDPSFAREIVSLFLESMPGNVDNLLMAENNKDYKQLSLIAHKMKGQIDLFNINSLKSTIRELEASKTGNENSRVLIEKTGEILQKVFAQLREFLKQI